MTSFPLLNVKSYGLNMHARYARFIFVMEKFVMNSIFSRLSL